MQRTRKDSSAPVRLGGIGFVLGEELEKITDLETRSVSVLVHHQKTQ